MLFINKYFVSDNINENIPILYFSFFSKSKKLLLFDHSENTSEISDSGFVFYFLTSFRDYISD